MKVSGDRPAARIFRRQDDLLGSMYRQKKREIMMGA